MRKDLGDGDVEGADWVAFERLPWLRLVLQVRQPGDAVSLEHTVKRGARQVLDGRLERIKTIIEWQQRELCGKATQAASCSADSTSERASCAPIGMSSTNLRLHHLRTVFGFRRYCAASAATQAFDRCIAARTVCLVAALP